MTENIKKRKFLAQIMEQYLEAIIEKNANGIPVAPDCKITFNGEISKLGENNLWYNTLTIRKRQTFFDTETGGIVFLGVTSNEVVEREQHFPIKEESAYVCYAVNIRLKVVDGKIFEIEELAWADRYRYFYCLPENIELPDVMFETAVPDDERMTREELIDIAELYWDGAFGTSEASVIPIHPDAERYENGYKVSNHSYSLRGDFKWNKALIDTGDGPKVTVPKEYRSYPVVDPARGIVISFVNMIACREPKFNLRIAEVFLVREGCIKRILALYPRLHNDGGWTQESSCREIGE